MKPSNEVEDKYTTIGGTRIHYQLCGRGPSALLLIHSAVGKLALLGAFKRSWNRTLMRVNSIGSVKDFVYQMADDEVGLSQEEFTIVALDLPGFGQSELMPSYKSDPNTEYFELCAEVGAKLMASLKYRTYSVGGWSDGAKVASILAINNQSRVNTLLLWGFVPIMDRKSCQAIAKTRDTSIWEPAALELYSSVYGEQRFSEMWRKYVDYVVGSLEKPIETQFDIRSQLRKIKCPTLILHGTNDPLVSFEDHIKPLEAQIYDSSIVQFKGCAHNLHQADPARFNQAITRFVTSVRA